MSWSATTSPGDPRDRRGRQRRGPGPLAAPERGLLYLDAFLPLAEQAGLMRMLTLVVLDNALAQARRWRDEGWQMSMAINLSVTNLLDADLPADVGRLLNTHDLPAAALTLEITESVLMADSSPADVDADGRARNAYTGVAPVAGSVPASPWALHLAASGGFRLLGFDLDAAHGPVAADLVELRTLLERAGLGRHVVCA